MTATGTDETAYLTGSDFNLINVFGNNNSVRDITNGNHNTLRRGCELRHRHREQRERKRRRATATTAMTSMAIEAALGSWRLLQRGTHDPESSSRGAQIRTGDPLLPKYGC